MRVRIMTDIEFNCPTCQHLLVVDERGAGKKVKCPKCAGEIIIPTPEDSEPVPTGAVCPKCGAISPTPSAKFCMKCGTNLQEQEVDQPAPQNLSLKLKPVALSQAVPGARGGTRKCMYCGRELALDAMGCSGCGRDFRPGSRVRNEKSPSKAAAAASGCWRVIVGVCKAIGIFFLIGIGINVWQKMSEKSSSQSGATQEKQTKVAAAPNVITEEFDISKLGGLKGSPSTAYDDGYIQGQYYQEFNRIKLNISVKNANLCDEKLEQLQSGISERMDNYHRTKQFVEGFRKGYFDPPNSTAEIQRRGEKIKEELAEPASEPITAAQNSTAASGQTETDPDKLVDTGLTLIKQGQRTDAFKYFKRAADAGNARGQYGLGLCYYKGDGVVANTVEAIRWFRKAAEQGYSLAQHNLGVFYEDGEGVVQNKMEALMWYHKAAEQGDKDSLVYYNKLNYELSKPYRDLQATKERMRRTAPELNPDDPEGNMKILKRRVEAAGLKWPGDSQ